MSSNIVLTRLQKGNVKESQVTLSVREGGREGVREGICGVLRGLHT